MERLKLWSVLLISAASCSTPGAVRIYSLDVDNAKMRHHESSISFDDNRLRCVDTEFGRECRYLCIDADDLEEILGLESK